MKTIKTKIKSLARGGTQFSFPNGITISIMFSSSNYGTNRNKPLEEMCTNVRNGLGGNTGHIVYGESVEATSVEVAIFDTYWDGTENWYSTETLKPVVSTIDDYQDTVTGWLPVNEAILLIPKVQAMGT